MPCTKLLILTDLVVIPSMHEIQQENNLNQKEQSRPKFGYYLVEADEAVRYEKHENYHNKPAEYLGLPPSMMQAPR